MGERWILNASPLIVLSRIGQERLLLLQADQVVVPHAVAQEIQAGPANDRARLALEAGRFTVMNTPPPPAEILAWDLGAGETAVLALALAENGWIAVLDDQAARKCARSFSLTVKGTLAVVLQAKQRGLIPSAVDVLRSLRESGFRLDDRVIGEAVAHTTGEMWTP